MRQNEQFLNFWELMDQAMAQEARTLHLAIGKPPMIRTTDGALVLLGPDYIPLTHKTLMAMLSVTVEPERWAVLERSGEGEVPLLRGGGGRPLNMVLFRSSDAWSAVVHL